MAAIGIPAAGPGAAEGKEASRTRAAATLRINEIFFSLQGETSRTGLPTVFVRLTGCPLRCGYCDTAYAFHEGSTRTLDEVLAEVAKYSTRYVCVTGGEPLAQKSCCTLLERLADAGYSVSLETGGAIDIGQVDARVARIVDIKTPGSGEADKNRWKNIALLTQHDEVKFVLCNEGDYRWAAAVLREHELDKRCPVLFSPVFGDLPAAALAEWILRDRLPVRLQIQLHKVLWNDARGR
jgi:7-carboxy-7-deazaguanine synthase